MVETTMRRRQEGIPGTPLRYSSSRRSGHQHNRVDKGVAGGAG